MGRGETHPDCFLFGLNYAATKYGRDHLRVPAILSSFDKHSLQTAVDYGTRDHQQKDQTHHSISNF